MDGEYAALVCENMYYKFPIGGMGIDKNLHPFWNDFELQFGSHLQNKFKLDAAAYDWLNNKVRFFNGDQYADIQNNQQVQGTPSKNLPISMWDQDTSNQCVQEGCIYCAENQVICHNCDTGYLLHNDRYILAIYFYFNLFESKVNMNE